MLFKSTNSKSIFLNLSICNLCHLELLQWPTHNPTWLPHESMQRLQLANHGWERDELIHPRESTLGGIKKQVVSSATNVVRSDTEQIKKAILFIL